MIYRATHHLQQPSTHRKSGTRCFSSTNSSFLQANIQLNLHMKPFGLHMRFASSCICLWSSFFSPNLLQIFIFRPKSAQKRLKSAKNGHIWPILDLFYAFLKKISKKPCTRLAIFSGQGPSFIWKINPNPIKININNTISARNSNITTTTSSSISNGAITSTSYATSSYTTSIASTSSTSTNRWKHLSGTYLLDMAFGHALGPQLAALLQAVD